MMTPPPNQSPSTPYQPSLIEAIDVWWSYTWRTLCLWFIAAIPIAIILTVVLSQATPGNLTEGQLIDVQDQVKHLMETSSHLIIFTNFVLNSIIGFIALREVIKITYPHFVFLKQSISNRDLWTISLLIHSFSLFCSVLAQPNKMTSELSLFLYFLIEFMVTCGILWHSMTNGILGSKLTTITPPQ